MTFSRVIASFDVVRADVIYGWRQLRKKKVTSAAAVLSLGLAIGACTAAFRLIDALLWRPLPISSPERLYGLVRQGPDANGKLRTNDAFEYPLFALMRARVRHDAELIAVSYASRVDVTYASDREMEKCHLQYVSGWMFDTFGLRPEVGRVLSESDDITPRAHPYAVLSHDYWSRRFGSDPAVVGRTLRIGRDLYTIVGVGPRGFTGTEPGTAIDVFVPTMMHDAATHWDWSTFRILAQLGQRTAAEPLLDALRGPYRAFNEERAKTFTGLPPQFIERFFRQTLLLEPAAAGVSNMQTEYRTALAVLGALVTLVLIIACVNVANLLTGQAAARAREMALRVSIGAGRGRLVQLVLVESVLLAGLAAVVGGLFASWSAPFVVSMINPPDNPARLFLPADWRVVGFGLALASIVTCVFGLMPALRASSVKPAAALKGTNAPRGRSRLMHALIVVQVAFCVLVLFVSGLFVATFDRLSRQTTGFSSERLLAIDTVASSPQSPTTWEQVTNRLRDTPGVETAALAGFSLLSGNGWNGSIAIGGATPSDELAYFLAVSPEWRETMRIPLLEGRNLRSTDISPGIALVNTTFVNHYFRGEPALGRSFEKAEGEGKRIRFVIVGIVGDARYRDMREPITPTVYVPFAMTDATGALQPKARAALIVRTASPNPMAMARTLREELPRIHPAFRATNIRTQEELNQSHTVRERMLAMLASFFAMVAVVLAGVGLYGVLHYSVLQRRKEIGICLALGARVRHVAHQVTAKMAVMVGAGGIAGIALGIATSRYAESLFYEVTSSDPANLIAPSLIMASVALVAALPPLLHAVRIDPVTMLRSE